MSEFEKEKIKDIQEEINTQKVKLEQLKIEKANLIAKTKEQHRETVSKINHDYAERMARVETLKLEANDWKKNQLADAEANLKLQLDDIESKY